MLAEEPLGGNYSEVLAVQWETPHAPEPCKQKADFIDFSLQGFRQNLQEWASEIIEW